MKEGFPSIPSDRYELIDLLGEGGMARVFRARDRNLDREVALKVPNDRVLADQATLERFRREARAAAALTHPNIVRIYDYIDDDALPCLVMELVHGRDLGSWMAGVDSLGVAETRRITQQILEAVAYAHDQGIIHRDLSPHNIIIEQETGLARVTDFGIARALGDQTLTDTGQMVGSVTTMSPEQAQGERVDPRSDLYSVGCLMYLMATGQLPFSGDNPVQVALKHVGQPPTPPRQINDQLPPDLEALILKALAKAPDDRPASAREMLESLSGVEVTPVSVARTRVRQAVPAPEPEPSRSGAGRWLLALVLIMLASGGLYAVSRWLAPTGIKVPPLIGLTTEQAQQRVEELGLKFEVSKEAPSETSPPGVVVYQSPPDGVAIAAGQTVRVTVSSGLPRIKLPKLEGLTVSEARSRLESAGLKVEIEEKADERFATGLVISHEPGEDAEVDRGATVKLFVSSGSRWVIVPQLEGLASEEARTVLERLGLEMAIDEYRPDPRADEEVVLSQNPSAGAKVRKGRRVFLILSKGKVDLNVPELEGKTISEARQILADLGLELTIEGDGRPDDPIVFQDPPPGDPVTTRTAIRVRTSPSTVVPVLQGDSENQARGKLSAAGLQVGQVRKVYGPVAGEVIGQEPLPGIEVPPGTRVDLFVADPALPVEPGPDATPLAPNPDFTPAPWVE
ncbi:MAG: PASTA domain-containing protein [Vulcanimicrobiota bacterium]